MARLECNSHTSARVSLDAIFAPRRVAVIGATERAGAVGRTILSNLLSHPFGREVFPINPKHKHVLGIEAFPDIAAVPGKIDLAVVITPACTVPDVIGQCADAGVAGAIIISAGFKELGPDGAELEQKVLGRARRGGMRLIGPNCLGVMNPITGLNATFAGAMANPGSVAFLSQSGALCTAILDWSLKENVGFSAFVSTGSMLDVAWGDLIDYLGDDPATKSILIYMESIGDARSFLSAAREVALNKPIIVLKAGRSDIAAKAAASHTGALAGSDQVLDAAFRRAGVLRVNNVADLFYMAEVLSKQPRPAGPRLTIITNAGGPGVLATDALIGAGGELAKLSTESIDALSKILPPHWSHANPIDILGDASAQRYADALKVVAGDPNTDGLLVILTPQDMTDPTATAEALKPYAHLNNKPVLANWMGGQTVEAGANLLRQAGIPAFAYPDTAARAFEYMWQYTYNLRGIYETPAASRMDDQHAHAAASHIIQQALLDGRTLLDEAESKNLISAYGIPTVQTEIAMTAETAIHAANAIGYPVVLKLYSKTITHKTDVGGVKLNLMSAVEIATAFKEIENSVQAQMGAGHFQGVTVQPMILSAGCYEIILGSSIDPQLGPVLLFGSGGELVEVFKDRSLGLPPLNATLARRMMEQTKIYKALQGVRGRKSANLAALDQLLVSFSRLVVDQPRIKEIDINPLLVSSERMMALDARVVLFGREILDGQLPRPAIRPYPNQYVWPWIMKDGTDVTIRPIRPDDEPLVVAFHKALSNETVQQRYFCAMHVQRRIEHERMIRVCYSDYDREICLVAEHRGADGSAEILGIGRMSKTPHQTDAEFAVVVSDRAQGRGLGTELLRCIVQIAQGERVTRLWANILVSNSIMQKIAERLGFRFSERSNEGTVRAEIHLETAAT